VREGERDQVRERRREREEGDTPPPFLFACRAF
jgi:hypothetical protein